MPQRLTSAVEMMIFSNRRERTRALSPRSTQSPEHSVGSGHLLQVLHEMYLISASGKTHEVGAADVPSLQPRKPRQDKTDPMRGTEPGSDGASALSPHGSDPHWALPTTWSTTSS